MSPRHGPQREIIMQAPNRIKGLYRCKPWCHRDMAKLCALLTLSEGNEFDLQRPLMYKDYNSFVPSLNKLLNKHSSCRWLDTPWPSCEVIRMLYACGRWLGRTMIIYRIIQKIILDLSKIHKLSYRKYNLEVIIQQNRLIKNDAWWCINLRNCWSKGERKNACCITMMS